MPAIGFTPITNKSLRAGDLAGFWRLRQGDTAVPLLAARFSDKSFHIFGVWGGGASVSLKGSNDPALASFETITDAFDTLITQIANGRPRTIHANVLALMPELTGGDSNTDIYIAIVGRGNLQ